MMNGLPYYLTNPEWYKLDPETGNYVLTDKAPEKAIKSFKEFNDPEPDENGRVTEI